MDVSIPQNLGLISLSDIHAFSNCTTHHCPGQFQINHSQTRYGTYASRSGSGMLASTLLISVGPKPVKVRLCLGRLNPGPTGPWRSAIGAPTEGFRSRRGSVTGTVVPVDDMVVVLGEDGKSKENKEKCKLEKVQQK
jgi:hypothetical protein